MSPPLSSEKSAASLALHSLPSTKTQHRPSPSPVSTSPFLLWAEHEKVVRSIPLHHLKGCKVGVDAIFFLESLGTESLLAALGGSPISIGAKIIDAVTILQDAGLSLHFVFDGLDYGAIKDSFSTSVSIARAVDEAFSRYDASEVDEARKIFSSIRTDASLFVKECQKTLYELGVSFSVSPYSAMAQLAYYDKHEKHFVDVVYGRPEMLCFGVDKLITKIDLQINSMSSVSSEPFVYWMSRKDCLHALGDPPLQILVDAILISGSALLAPLPLLAKDITEKNKHIIRDAVALISGAGGSVSRLCLQSNDPAIREVYRDQYKAAIASIKHHVIVTSDGDVEMQSKTEAVGITDSPEFIGLRLPEELLTYLMHGLIQPQVLNCLTSGKIDISMPSAGGESTHHQHLIRDQLKPIRLQTISILANQINRYYQIKEINVNLWFDRAHESRFTSKTAQSYLKSTFSKRPIPASLLREVPMHSFEPGTLAFAVCSLDESAFARNTTSPKSADTAIECLLDSTHEIITNAIWRLLQLRGYINDKHQLTEWGAVLRAVLSTAGSRTEMQEAAFLAVELLRYGLLTSHSMFADLKGVPMYGSDRDKRNCILVSRIACLGRIRHNSKGYTGPLSKHLLAYQCMTARVQAGLRDCLEMIVAAMLLEGSINRNRDDWMRLSLEMPFYGIQSCALGVLTMHYLDELCNRESPTSRETKEEIKREGQSSWLAGSQFSESLDDVFNLWDAIFKGVNAAGHMIEDVEMWNSVNEWLAERR